MNIDRQPVNVCPGTKNLYSLDLAGFVRKPNGFERVQTHVEDRAFEMHRPNTNASFLYALDVWDLGKRPFLLRPSLKQRPATALVYSYLERRNRRFASPSTKLLENPQQKQQHGRRVYVILLVANKHLMLLINMKRRKKTTLTSIISTTTIRRFCPNVSKCLFSRTLPSCFSRYSLIDSFAGQVTNYIYEYIWIFQIKLKFKINPIEVFVFFFIFFLCCSLRKS